MQEPRWTWVEHPQPVGDEELPRSAYYLVDDGVVVAEVTHGGEEACFQLVKRLNQWETDEADRLRRDLEGC